MPRSTSSDPAAASSQAAELQQPEEKQSDLTEGTQLHLQRQTDVQQANVVQTDQGRTDEHRQAQGQAQEGLTDQGLAGGVQGDRGQIAQADNVTAVEEEQGGSARRRVTRASARQVALVLDMHHSGVPHFWKQIQVRLLRLSCILRAPSPSAERSLTPPPPPPPSPLCPHVHSVSLMTAGGKLLLQTCLSCSEHVLAALSS